MNILGIKIDNLSKEEVLKKITDFLSEEKFHQVATVGPEFILKSERDADFRNILNSCDLNVADGMGVRLAFWRHGERLKERIAGIDLMWEILKIADEKNMKVFLVSRDGGLSAWEETKKAILEKYPNLKIKGDNIDILDNSYRVSDADIVFCNFGAPDQEKFLNRQKNANIRLGIGVGGSFDFITGKIKRAPKFMRSMGLEWLFRLFQQPKRIGRILNAVVVFPMKIIFN